MRSPRPLASIALAGLLTAALLHARPHDLAGAWSLQGGDATALACAATADGLALTRRTVDGKTLEGRGTLSATGWLAGRFEASPGLVAAASDPAALVGALAGPRSGFGLWEMIEEAGHRRLVGFYVGPDGVRRFERGGRPDAPAPGPPGGFVHHLREAIALNGARRPGYEARSGGESAALSRRLVLLERLVKPWAWWVDLRAKRWNRRGVMIVAGDFVSMQNVRPADTPPPFAGRMSDEQAAHLDRRLAAFRRDVRGALDANRFEDAARLARDLLAEVEALERSWGCTLAMTRHVVEQVGFAALNALTWRAESGGQTDGLARSFLRGLRWGLNSSLDLDRRAQACHARGVGIIVNDVPEIPLAASYDAWRERQGH